MSGRIVPNHDGPECLENTHWLHLLHSLIYVRPYLGEIPDRLAYFEGSDVTAIINSLQKSSK
jgi:hypothetical protein